MVRIEFSTANAAFDESRNFEIARILRDLAKRFRERGDDDSAEYHLNIHDANGNRIGTCRVEESE